MYHMYKGMRAKTSWGFEKWDTERWGIKEGMIKLHNGKFGSLMSKSTNEYWLFAARPVTGAK